MSFSLSIWAYVNAVVQRKMPKKTRFGNFEKHIFGLFLTLKQNRIFSQCHFCLRKMLNMNSNVNNRNFAIHYNIKSLFRKTMLPNAWLPKYTPWIYNVILWLTCLFFETTFFDFDENIFCERCLKISDICTIISSQVFILTMSPAVYQKV